MLLSHMKAAKSFQFKKSYKPDQLLVTLESCYHVTPDVIMISEQLESLIAASTHKFYSAQWCNT